MTTAVRPVTLPAVLDYDAQLSALTSSLETGAREALARVLPRLAPASLDALTLAALAAVLPSVAASLQGTPMHCPHALSCEHLTEWECAAAWLSLTASIVNIPL